MTGSLQEQSCTEAESDEARQNAEAEKAASIDGTGVPASVRGECMRREHLNHYTIKRDATGVATIRKRIEKQALFAETSK